VKRPVSLAEVKYVDTSIGQVVDTTGAVTLIDGMSQGNTVSTRVGRQVSLKKIEYNLVMYPTITTGVDQVGRFILFYDRQTNGAAPAVIDVLTAATPFALYNRDNLKRFRIIADVCKNLNPTSESDTNMVTGNVSKSIVGMVQFNAGNAGTVADIISGGLFLLSVGSVAAGATAGSLAGRARACFTDY
jgi:hypothetical protein